MAFRTEARWKNYGGRAWWGRAVYIMETRHTLKILGSSSLKPMNWNG